MTKRIVVAGMLGGMVLIVWAAVVDGILGFGARINLKPIPAERPVYEILKEHIQAPGRYACNPPLTAEHRFRDGEPVYSILYGGVGHEAAGHLAVIGLLVFLLAPTMAAWLLSQTSDRVLTSYPRKVRFVVAIGVLVATLSDLTSYGIGNYPLKDALWLGAEHIAAWTLAALVVAWRIRPDRCAS